MDDGEGTASLGRPSLADRIFETLQRMMALLCLVFGVFYWARLIGFHEGTAWRFDLMPAHWQAASAALSVFYPFAAIGLWMLASWGPVIWFICAAAEAVMHLAFPNLFGEADFVLGAHALTALAFVACRAAIYRQKRAEEVSAH